MVSFSQYENISENDGSLVEYSFVGIDGKPSLMVRFAGESNKKYFDGQLRLASKISRSKKVITSDHLEMSRESDYKLYPKFVVDSWGGSPPIDSESGSAASFSREICEQFLRAIPSDMFDDLRSFCGDISNWRDDVPTPEEVEELSGN